MLIAFRTRMSSSGGCVAFMVRNSVTKGTGSNTSTRPEAASCSRFECGANTVMPTEPCASAVVIASGSGSTWSTTRSIAGRPL